MKRDLVLLTLLGLLAYLPGLAALPVIDRDEARYAQSVVQMVETGDYIDIRLQSEPRYKKPIGAYWAQVAAVFATGQADDIQRGERPIWAQRLPSVLGALIAVWATYLAGQALFGRREAFVGAALLAVSVSLVFEAHQAKTDALLVGACAVALYGLAKGRAWPFWLAVGAGVLVKGPVIVGVVGLAISSIAILQRLSPPPPAGEVSAEPTEGGSPSPKTLPSNVLEPSFPPPTLRATSPASGGGRVDIGSLLRPLPILVTLALVLPWFIAIGVVSDGAFYSEALGRDFGGKLGSAQESHGGPPGYYLLTTLLMWWPGILALPAAAVWSWRERRTPAVTLLLCWLVPMWLVLELVPTKLPHYTLPLYPALALLCGAAVVRVWGRSRALQLGGLLAAAIAGLGLVALGLWLDVPRHPLITAALAIPCAGAMLFGLWSARHSVVFGTALASVAVSVWVFGLNTRTSGKLALSQRVAAALSDPSPTLDIPVEPRLVTQDFREPSLVYALGTATRLDLCDVRRGDVVMIEESPELQRLNLGRRGRYALMGAAPCMDHLRRVSGGNLAKGRDDVTLRLFATDACEPETLGRWAREQADPTLDCGG